MRLERSLLPAVLLTAFLSVAPASAQRVAGSEWLPRGSVGPAPPEQPVPGLVLPRGTLDQDLVVVPDPWFLALVPPAIREEPVAEGGFLPVRNRLDRSRREPAEAVERPVDVLAAHEDGPFRDPAKGFDRRPGLDLRVGDHVDHDARPEGAELGRVGSDRTAVAEDPMDRFVDLARRVATVEDRDRVTLGRQAGDDVPADEARAAENEDPLRHRLGQGSGRSVDPPRGRLT